MPRSCFRSSMRERLPRLIVANPAVTPPRWGPSRRMMSPPGGASTLITSAPWSASSMVAIGPETIVASSITR